MAFRAAGPRAGRASRAALLLLLSAATAQGQISINSMGTKESASADSDATCTPGEPGCDLLKIHTDCPTLDPTMSQMVKGCAQGSKYWRWAMNRFYRKDEEGALGFLNTAYRKCMKKQKQAVTEDCLREWAKNVIQYRWSLEGPGVTDECTKEANAKYTSGSARTKEAKAKAKEIEECAQTYSETLDSATEEGDKSKLGKAYQDILQKCAEVSEDCALQNGYMLARTPKSAFAEEAKAEEDKGMWGGLNQILARRWAAKTDL